MTDSREALGRLVRETWVEWAREQPDPKPSWLVPWEDLDEGQREVDMRIGEAVTADSEQAWGEWWDIQYHLGRHMEERIEKVAEGRSDQFKAALVASLIEHLGEQLQRYLKLRDSDTRG